MKQIKVAALVWHWALSQEAYPRQFSRVCPSLLQLGYIAFILEYDGLDMPGHWIAWAFDSVNMPLPSLFPEIWETYTWIKWASFRVATKI